MIPLTNYQVDKIKFYGLIASALMLTILITGNIITYAIADKAQITRSSYILRKGLPYINNACEYLNLIKKYPHNPGVKLKIHSVNYGESLWSLMKVYNVSIDTILGANPWLKKLTIEKGQQLVIPEKNGYLFAVDDRFDAGSVAKNFNYDSAKIKGQFSWNIFKIFCKDSIRLLFLPKVKPLLVNPKLELLYAYRKQYQAPISGNYTSLFGIRLDPIFKCRAFHNGLDINGSYGAPIKPFAPGMVIFIGWRDGFGKSILIQHKNGITSLYAHCSRIIIKKGDWVTKKTLIGKVGSTGRSTGPHLHFSIYKYGKEVNPILYIW
jgi:murein DD-endopeptidase MepM/ murein hydrolase activator NlpD